MLIKQNHLRGNDNTNNQNNDHVKSNHDDNDNSNIVIKSIRSSDTISNNKDNNNSNNGMTFRSEINDDNKNGTAAGNKTSWQYDHQ